MGGLCQRGAEVAGQEAAARPRRREWLRPWSALRVVPITVPALAGSGGGRGRGRNSRGQGKEALTWGDYRGAARARARALAKGIAGRMVGMLRSGGAEMDQDLKGALGLTGPEACLAYYRDWAATYDRALPRACSTAFPPMSPAAFRAQGRGAGAGRRGGDGPSGRTTARDGLSGGEIDAVDFSAEMLARAAEKRIYAGLFVRISPSP